MDIALYPPVTEGWSRGPGQKECVLLGNRLYLPSYLCLGAPSSPVTASLPFTY